MKSKTKWLWGGLVVVICSVSIVAMKAAPDSQQVASPSKYVINIDPDKDTSRIAISELQTLTEAELRKELAIIAPRLFKIEQLAAFVHALQLYMQDNNFQEYEDWEKTWFDASTTLFVFANLTGNNMRNALKPGASRLKLEIAYVSAVTMTPLLEEASSDVSSGVLLDVFGYTQGDLLLESWPRKK